MSETYAFRRDVLRLLRWRCNPTSWRLCTPDHTRAQDAYPSAKFLWCQRDPAKVQSSVPSGTYISLAELGAQQLTWLVRDIGRAMEFRRKHCDGRFVDISFAHLQADPISEIETSWAKLRLRFACMAEPHAKVGGCARAGSPRHAYLRPHRARADTRTSPGGVQQLFGHIRRLELRP